MVNTPEATKTLFRNNASDDEVIYQSSVPPSSIGFTQHEFFMRLGHPSTTVGREKQELEQVYLLKNMHKAGLFEAAQIAIEHNIGIAVRGTGLLAHMGIESGNPTKSVEFKNKTSKPVDLLLCPELEWKDLGSVIHFDPRVGWSSEQGKIDAKKYGVAASRHASLVSGDTATSAPGCLSQSSPLKKPSSGDWARKRAEIEMRMPALMNLPQAQATAKHSRFSFPSNENDWRALEGKFDQRLKEYLDEDRNYREGGHYAQHVHLQGIHIRAAQRPDCTMVGDHDLFGFTDPLTHKFLPVEKTTEAQNALQKSNGFQAQHGGIWNWKPVEAKNQEIKRRIMSAHCPGEGEPLVYFNPLYKDDVGPRPVSVAFYISGQPERVRTVWHFPHDKAWQSV